MRVRVVLMLVATMTIAGFVLAPVGPRAQGSAGLTGTVSSQREGPMEGVVVSARRDGSNATVSVVTDAGGRYSFPRSHVAAGRYTLTMRAVGYDLVDPGAVSVTDGATATRDLRLEPAKDLPSQLSSLEWIMSMPGTTAQKEQLAYQGLSCAYCHTYERIVKSKHDAAQMVPVISRMQTYFNDGTALGHGNRGRAALWGNRPMSVVEKTPNWGSAPKKDMAAYLATVNLSGGRSTWPYELKTLPRPAGKATRVIMTQYDMPRPDTVPHDMAVAADGTPWYGDQSRMIIGKMDPKTGQFKEWSMPPLPKGHAGGISDIDVDHEGNVWFPATPQEGDCHFGTPTRFNPKTETFETIDDPGKHCLQFTDVGPDGKVWMNNVSVMVRIDPKAFRIDGVFPFTKGPNVPQGVHVGYQVVVNSKGNAYISDFSGSYVVGVNGSNGEVSYYPTPQRPVLPRRGQFDAQDRYWFAEYGGDRITMFDTRSNTFTQYPVGLKYTTPYATSAPDRNGHVYASSNMSERILRLDPKTREVIEYQVPTDFDSKELIHDPVATRTTVWMANTRNARLLKLEPLD
ncbi:MAG: hypothetical protein FJW23_10795 [Acidimicrobiia bacterium]|nr:hypothetical protein [Acidimicrobiia bacterium]